MVGRRKVLGTLARKPGKELDNRPKDVDGHDAASVQVGLDGLPEVGVDDRVEDGRRDEVSLVLVEVVAHTLHVDDLGKSDDAHRTLLELGGGGEDDVKSGVAKRVRNDIDDGGILLGHLAKLVVRYLHGFPPLPQVFRAES